MQIDPELDHSRLVDSCDGTLTRPVSPGRGSDGCGGGGGVGGGVGGGETSDRHRRRPLAQETSIGIKYKRAQGPVSATVSRRRKARRSRPTFRLLRRRGTAVATGCVRMGPSSAAPFPQNHGKWRSSIASAILTIMACACVFVSLPGLGKNIRGGSYFQETKREHPSLPPMTLVEARRRPLTPLRSPLDYEQYTIRINTWRRNEQLVISLNHHSSCEGVAQIQVIWCDPENDPPEEVINHKSGKVVVERHGVNSLNERFNILLEPPTMGILSIDDDVLRPCMALDSGFFRWIRSPNRMVGYDSRVHVEDEEGWKYGPLSVATETNSYSLTLTRFSFIHRDYLDLYMSAMPRSVLVKVEDNLNCEDIAMSFFVTAMTGGRPPLLASFWAVKAQVKMFQLNGISTSISGHRYVRDECVDGFATVLGLKGSGNDYDDDGFGESDGVARIKAVPVNLFSESGAVKHYGALMDEEDNHMPLDMAVRREEVLSDTIRRWVRTHDMSGWEKLVHDTEKEAREHGLVERTEEWYKRWKGLAARSKRKRRMGGDVQGTSR